MNNNNMPIIMKLNQNLKKFIEVLNMLIPITNFIGESGVTFCPFHTDIKKPSAKIFIDDDYPKLWCYACRKQYTSYDYIKEILFEDPISYLLLRHNPELIVALYDKIIIEDKKEIEEGQFVKECQDNFNNNIVEYIDNIYKLKEVNYVCW